MRFHEWVMSIAAAMACALAAGSGVAVAQTGASRVEVGGQLAVLRLSDTSDTNVGLGGRVTFDIAPWVSVEGEYQFIPSDQLEMTSVLTDGSVVGLRYERRRSTALFGVKAGYRGEQVGLFAKVRPGFTQLTHRGVDCLGDVCALMLLAVPEYRREFALDVGGVVEVYPSSRWVARADVGSLVIAHRSSAPPCAGGSCTSANLAASLGVGLRF